MIIFREIGKSNYMECIYLKVKDEQRGLVVDNAYSLAETRFEEGLYTRAVCSDGIMVGFVLFDYNSELPGRCMSRFVTGAQCQKRGLGEETVLRFLDFMREHMKVREFYLHVELENMATYETYQELDFRATREIQYTFDGAVYQERRMKICL